MDLGMCRAPLAWLCFSPFMVMSEGQKFFQSLTNACHAQPPAGEFPAHSQTWLALLLPQGWPWLWAGKLSSWRRNITGVCSATTLHGRCFWKEQEGKLYSTLPWLTICSVAKASTTPFTVRSFTPRPLHLQGSCALAHRPLDSLWQDRLKPLPFLCLSSKVPQPLTAHFTRVYF